MLDHRLADALGDAALHLAFGQQRIDQPAVIVDRSVVQQAHRTGLGIDLDLGDMAAAREGEDIGHVHHMHSETSCHAVRQIGRIVGASRQGRQGDGAPLFPGAAAHRETSVGERQLFLRGLQKMGCQAARLGERRVDRLDDGRAAHMHGARAAMPCPAFDGARVGLHVADCLHRHAQPVGGDLGVGGLVSLAVGLGADRDRHRAIAFEAHLRALVGRAARGF